MPMYVCILTFVFSYCRTLFPGGHVSCFLSFIYCISYFVHVLLMNSIETDRHDIHEILLKVVLNTINLKQLFEKKKIKANSKI